MKRSLLSTVSVDRRLHSAGTIGNLLSCDIPQRSTQAAHTATHQRTPMFTLQVCNVQLCTRNAVFTIPACLVQKSRPGLYPIKLSKYCAVVSADARTYRKFLKQDTQGGYCLLSSNKTAGKPAQLAGLPAYLLDDNQKSKAMRQAYERAHHTNQAALQPA